MKIITPVALTDAMLTSSTVAEPATGESTWNAASSYSPGAQVIRTTVHRKFQRLGTAGVDAGLPESTPTLWQDIGPTMRWAMFDNVVGTVTTVTTPLTVVLRPGFTGGLSAMELVGTTATVTMKAAAGGAVVYSRTVDLDGSIVNDVFDWMFGPYLQRTDFTLTDLPESYADPELTISITAASGSVACGLCKTGRVTYLGRTLRPVSVGIVDYSIKEKDAFGNLKITERAYSKRGTFKVLVPRAQFNATYRALAILRATLAIYVATDLAGFEPLLICGFFKDFSIDVEYESDYLCNLEIEGII